MDEPQRARAFFVELAARVDERLFGLREPLRLVMVGILTGNHVLIDDVPGVGKTTLVRMLATLLGLGFRRVQFTPDLMPSDVTGTSVLNLRTNDFEFRPGPVFTQVLLADEINRATPKTQSALLEAMQERTVTSGTTTHQLDSPFLVMATQNPIEMEGTYPLPEAQLDRFLMKILVEYPTRDDLNRIVERTIQRDEPELSQVLDRDTILSIRSACREVLVAPHVLDFAVSLVMATQPNTPSAHPLASKYIRYGASPRGAQSLVECGRVYALMNGRAHLSIDDVRTIAHAVLRHRIILNFDAHADDQTPETLLKEIIPATAKTAAVAR